MDLEDDTDMGTKVESVVNIPVFLSNELMTSLTKGMIKQVLNSPLFEEKINDQIKKWFDTEFDQNDYLDQDYIIDSAVDRIRDNIEVTVSIN